jgi:adenylylsulfate kinase-like enzyme
VVVAAISPYDATRKTRARARRGAGPFVEVWVKASVEECAARDAKGLYAKAFAGEITQFTGVDDPYEEPDDAEVVADTGRPHARRVGRARHGRARADRSSRRWRAGGR